MGRVQAIFEVLKGYQSNTLHDIPTGLSVFLSHWIYFFKPSLKKQLSVCVSVSVEVGLTARVELHAGYGFVMCWKVSHHSLSIRVLTHQDLWWIHTWTRTRNHFLTAATINRKRDFPQFKDFCWHFGFWCENHHSTEEGFLTSHHRETTATLSCFHLDFITISWIKETLCNKSPFVLFQRKMRASSQIHFMNPITSTQGKT